MLPHEERTRKKKKSLFDSIFSEIIFTFDDDLHLVTEFDEQFIIRIVYHHVEPIKLHSKIFI